jgi:hypothetical protein
MKTTKQTPAKVATKGKPGAIKIHIDPKKVERLASQGLTKQQIVDSLGISDETLRRREKEDVELVEAIKRGRAQGLNEVTNALFEAAISGNVTAQIWYLKNRAPSDWRDRVEVEIDGGLPQPLIIHVPTEGPIIDVKPEQVPTIGTQKAG